MNGRAMRAGATVGALIVLGLLEAGAAAIGSRETGGPAGAPRFAYHLRVVRVAGTSDYRGAALGCNRTCGRPILVPSEEVWGTPDQLDGLARALGGARADAVSGFIVLPEADGTAQFEATVYPGEAVVGLSFSAQTPVAPGAPHDMHLTVTPADGGEPLAEARILSASEKTVAIAAPSPVAGEWLVLAVTTLDPEAAEARVTNGVQPEAIEGPITPPVLIDKVLPRYTPQARKEGRQGTVILSAVIDVEGSVRAPMVLHVDPGLEELAASAVEAVGKWRYHPAMRDGDPVAVNFTILVEFRLT